MKGYDLENNFKDKLLHQYNNEYGLNFNNSLKDDNYDDYDRYFKTKNNLNIHNKIRK